MGRLGGLLLVVPVLLAACGGDGREEVSSELGARGDDYVIVGSGDSAESQIVASLYAQALADGDLRVVRELRLGSDATAFEAVRKGTIDLAPQPVGSLTAALGGTPSVDADEARDDLERLLPEGLGTLDASGADGRYALVVTRRTADAEDLRQVADLVGRDLVVGGPPGCPVREACLPGLAGVLGQAAVQRFRGLDEGGRQTRQALARGDIDVAVLPSTDGAIEASGWIRLEDGRRPLSPSQAFVPVYRADLLDDDARRRVARLSDELTDEALRDMVARVTVRQADPQSVAGDYVRARNLVDA